MILETAHILHHALIYTYGTPDSFMKEIRCSKTEKKAALFLSFSDMMMLPPLHRCSLPTRVATLKSSMNGKM